MLVEQEGSRNFDGGLLEEEIRCTECWCGEVVCHESLRNKCSKQCDETLDGELYELGMATGSGFEEGSSEPAVDWNRSQADVELRPWY